MRGGNGGSRSFLSEVDLSFVSMIVLRKGEEDMCGRKWIRVAIGRRIDGRMRGKAWKASLIFIYACLYR